MEDITKLPKWGQAHIEQLTYERDKYQAKWESVFEGEPTSIEVKDILDKPSVFLPPHSYIYFKTNKKRNIADKIRVYLDSDNRLVVNGDDVLKILPRASNSFYVEMGE